MLWEDAVEFKAVQIRINQYPLPYKKFGNLDSGQYTIIKSKQEEHADS